MKKYGQIVLIIITLLYLFSCETKTAAFGELNEIIVVTDSTQRAAVEDSIAYYFFPGRKMPVYEPSFSLKFVQVEDLSHYTVRKNLFIIGTLDDRNRMSEFLKKVLPAVFKDQIRNGASNYTWQNDLYSYNQNVLFFASENMKTIFGDMAKHSQTVAGLWQNQYREDLLISMFEAGEQKEIEAYIMRMYDFAVRVQHDYFIADEEQDNNFIWLRRLDRLKEISRDLFIKYYEKGDTITLTNEWLVEERKKIADREFGRDEEIVPSETYALDTYVGTYSAIKLEGTWRTSDLMIGGPFSMYSFYVPEQNRVYIIEGSVTAVGRRKTPYINQLELIAESFHISGNGIETKNK